MYTDELKKWVKQNSTRLEKLRTDSSELEKITNEVWKALDGSELSEYIEFFLKLGSLLNWKYSYDSTDLDEYQDDRVFIHTPDGKYTYFFCPDLIGGGYLEKLDRQDKEAIHYAFEMFLNTEDIREELVNDFLSKLMITTIDDYGEVDDDEIKNA